MLSFNTFVFNPTSKFVDVSGSTEPLAATSGVISKIISHPGDL